MLTISLLVRVGLVSLLFPEPRLYHHGLGCSFHEIVKADVARFIGHPGILTTLLEDEEGDLSVVLSEFFKLVFLLQVLLVVLESTELLIHDLLEVWEVVLGHSNFISCDHFADSEVEVFVIFEYLFILCLIALSLFYQFSEFLCPLFTDFHDLLFLLLVVFKCLLSLIHIYAAHIQGGHDGGIRHASAESPVDTFSPFR